MSKILSLTLTLTCITSVLTGCNNGESTTRSANVETKPRATSVPTADAAPKLGLQDMRAVSSFLRKAREEGAPVQVRPGQTEGSIEYPAVLVFGKDGCFSGSFIMMSDLTSTCKNPRSSISELPQSLSSIIDAKSGGVVLVWIETEYKCEACIDYRSAARAFAKNKHPSIKYEEYKISMR